MHFQYKDAGDIFLGGEKIRKYNRKNIASLTGDGCWKFYFKQSIGRKGISSSRLLLNLRMSDQSSYTIFEINLTVLTASEKYTFEMVTN